jgi:hypothetical protein
MQLAVADVDAHHLRGAVLQQAVGEAAGGLAHVEAQLAGDVEPGDETQRAFQLEPAARHVAGLGGIGQLELGRSGSSSLVLDDRRHASRVPASASASRRR